jgi:hypothetical protein
MTHSHWGFILAAYLVTGLVIGGMILKIWLDYRGLRRALGRMVGTSPDRDAAV